MSNQFAAPRADALPDVAYQQQSAANGMLDWVGMGNMQMPVLLRDAAAAVHPVPALVDCFVNLTRSDVRGIHMSRLYLHVEQALASGPLQPALLRALLRACRESQGGLADQARLCLRYSQLVRRPALKSDYSGWRTYPMRIDARLDAADRDTLEWSTEVEYSSTCPASAALARQLVQQQFARDFESGSSLSRSAILDWLGSERGMIATPHAQRSIAKLRLRPAAGTDFDPIAIIDVVEKALGTPVQTAVKRADEQAFALANGRNLLFCEDAARRIQKALRSDSRLADFALRVSHEESLHPHDAVAYASKGVPGGYDAMTLV